MPTGTMANAAMRSSMLLMMSSWPRRKNMPELVRMLRAERVPLSLGRAVASLHVHRHTRCRGSCPSRCPPRMTSPAAAWPVRRGRQATGLTHAVRGRGVPRALGARTPRPSRSCGRATRVGASRATPSKAQQRQARPPCACVERSSLSVVPGLFHLRMQPASHISPCHPIRRSSSAAVGSAVRSAKRSTAA